MLKLKVRYELAIKNNNIRFVETTYKYTNKADYMPDFDLVKKLDTLTLYVMAHGDINGFSADEGIQDFEHKDIALWVQKLNKQHNPDHILVLYSACYSGKLKMVR
jgi:hypothetical protein